MLRTGYVAIAACKNVRFVVDEFACMRVNTPLAPVVHTSPGCQRPQSTCRAQNTSIAVSVTAGKKPPVLTRSSSVPIAGTAQRSGLQWHDPLADRYLEEQLPIRTFPAHDPVDQMRPSQIRNCVVASPYRSPF
jgi:hypothetical protein